MTEDRYQDNAEGNKEDVIRMDDHSNHNKSMFCVLLLGIRLI